MREQEAWDRIRNKERDLEKMSFEHRQKVMHNEELGRFREADSKKTVEVEQTLLRQERDQIGKLEKELARKIKEAEDHK